MQLQISAKVNLIYYENNMLIMYSDETTVKVKQKMNLALEALIHWIKSTDYVQQPTK